MAWAAREWRGLSPELAVAWRDLRDLHNALVHAGPAKRLAAQRALDSPEAFLELFAEGKRLLARICEADPS